MSKRNEPENRSSSSPSQLTPSPKRKRRSSSTVMEDTKQSEALSLEQFKQIMNKLSRLDNREEHFRNLTSEISILRHEMKQELDGVKKFLRDVEKSIEAAWDSINDIQEETKTQTPQRLQENMPTKPRLSSPRIRPAQSKPQKS